MSPLFSYILPINICIIAPIYVFGKRNSSENRTKIPPFPGSRVIFLPKFPCKSPLSCPCAKLPDLLNSVLFTKEGPPVGWAFAGRDTGVDYTFVLPPSSRRQKNVRRTFSFISVRLPSVFQKERPPVGWSFFLEQDTGVEPAFTAWEAVVLPIYESCKSEAIIAKQDGKSNHFLSMESAFPSTSEGTRIHFGAAAVEPGGRQMPTGHLY